MLSRSFIEYDYHQVEHSLGVALLLHPHPLYEGNMLNKVITTAQHACTQCQLSTVKYNYPGVGRTQGYFGYGRYEAEVGLALLNELAIHEVDWVIGFSFGCWVSYQLLLNIQPKKGLIWIAPSIKEGLFFEAEWPKNRFMIQGTQDELCPYATNHAFSDQHDFFFEPIEGASHFFHGQLIELREVLGRCLTF